MSMRMLCGAIVMLAAATVFGGTMIYSGLVKAAEIQVRGGGHEKYTEIGFVVAVVLGIAGAALLVSGFRDRDAHGPT
jgi:hypothetical protein